MCIQQNITTLDDEILVQYMQRFQIPNTWSYNFHKCVPPYIYMYIIYSHHFGIGLYIYHFINNHIVKHQILDWCQNACMNLISDKCTVICVSICVTEISIDNTTLYTGKNTIGRTVQTTFKIYRSIMYSYKIYILTTTYQLGLIVMWQ